MEESLKKAEEYIKQVFEKRFGGGADKLDVKTNPVNADFSWEVTHKEEGWLAYIPQKWVEEEREEDVVKNLQYILDRHREKMH
jgi:hypothetical protein